MRCIEDWIALGIKLHAIASVTVARKRAAPRVASLSLAVCVGNFLSGQFVSKRFLLTYWCKIHSTTAFTFAPLKVFCFNQVRVDRISVLVYVTDNFLSVISLTVAIGHWVTLCVHRLYRSINGLGNFAKLVNVSNTNTGQDTSHVSSVCLSGAFTFTLPFIC